MYPNNNCNDCPPCPGTITPLPLPDLSGLCGDEYNAACVIYTGPDIKCLNITSGMTLLEVLTIFNNVLPGCDCCEKIPQNCVVGPWSDWSQCECYYENELLICGRQTRTRSIITPPLNGGTACPPLSETRSCTIEQVCFTFGSDLCNSAPDATQVLASPEGLYNNKPYYELYPCDPNDDPLFVWYNTNNNLWYITPVLGTPNQFYQTLNNGGNYLPISNETTQKWSFVELEGFNGLISSQTTTCPDVKICFEFVIQLEAGSYTLYSNIGPSRLGENSYPIYEWSYDGSVPYGPYNITVGFDVSENKWVYVVSNSLDPTPLTWGTLDTNTFYPISTSTVEWEPVENMGVYTTQMLSSTQSNCVQPPDVPCVLNCGPWSDCIGGTRTRTCTIVTPPSGNVPPCDPLIQTEVCSVPSCFPPTAVVATQTGSSVIITFTGVSGAANYEVTYTVNGGSPLTVTGTSSPIILPYVCDAEYEGTIVTNCTNLLTSSAVSWGPITTDPCGICSSFPARPMIGGLSITSPVGGTIALNSTGDTQYGGNLNFGSTGYRVAEIVAIPAGYVYAGTLSFVSSGSFPAVSGFFGAILIGCDFQPVTSFFGSGFTTSTNAPGTIETVVYDAPTNRLYIGGTFSKYKGVNCTPNIVVLNATTGNIDTTFATNSVGAARTTGFVEVASIFIQNDGKILVGGTFDSMYGNTTCKYICRFLPTGVIDTSFNPGTSISSSTLQLSIYKVIANSANEIFIGGTFEQYQGVPRYGLAKLSSNGSLITTFNPGVITYTFCTASFIKDIQFQGSNILVAGSATVFNGTSAPGGLARLNATTGLIDPTFNMYTPLGTCKIARRIVVKNNRIYVGTTWTGYSTSNKALYYVLDANGNVAFNTTVVITPGNIASSIDAMLIPPY